MIEKYLNRDIYYTNAGEFFTLGANGQLQCAASEIDKSSPARLLVINASDEDWGPNHHVVYHKLLGDLGRPFVLLTGDRRAHDPDKNCFWYQDSYFFTVRYYTKHTGDITDSRKFSASLISRFARPHRIYFWLRFQERIHDPRVIFTMRGGRGSIPRHDDLVLDHDDRERWSRQSQQLEDLDHMVYIPKNHYHPAWTQSYLNLVLESTITSFGHTTEKVWLPIIAGQLFLVYGNPGVISVLRDQGVDVFDDLFDHDHYDRELDPMLRAKKVLDVLQHFLLQNTDELWQQTSDRRQKNIDRFWNMELVPAATHDLIKRLQA